jgi:hypothetical protein
MFHTNWDGDIDSFSSALEPRVEDIVFTRLPDKRMKERSFLEPLEGTYQVADYKIVVTLRPDNVLALTMPNQKTYELDPVRGNRFRLRGEPATSIDFQRDRSGKVTEASLNEAGSSSVYTKTQ